jgi:hypothetical protein
MTPADLLYRERWQVSHPDNQRQHEQHEGAPPQRVQPASSRNFLTLIKRLPWECVCIPVRPPAWIASSGCWLGSSLVWPSWRSWRCLRNGCPSSGGVASSLGVSHGSLTPRRPSVATHVAQQVFGEAVFRLFSRSRRSMQQCVPCLSSRGGFSFVRRSCVLWQLLPSRIQDCVLAIPSRGPPYLG